MKIHVYANRPRPELQKFIEGLERHGLSPVQLKSTDYKKCDLAVSWSHKNLKAFQSGRRYLVAERGYVGDRFYWTSLGYDGLNGRANFYNKDMPGDRWNKNFSHLMKDWKDTTNNEYVLIMGQVRGDAALRQINILEWYVNQTRGLQNLGHTVRFRRHPKDKDRFVHYTTLNGELNEALDSAKWVVTYNSNSGVDSVLNGTPTVAMDAGSMVYSLVSHDSSKMPEKVDRTKWSHNLAYCQWSPEEISRGDAWDHLKQGMIDA